MAVFSQSLPESLWNLWALPLRFASLSSFTHDRNYMIQWSCGRADGQPALNVNKHTVLYNSLSFFTNKYSFNLVCCTPFSCKGDGYTDICNSIPPQPSSKLGKKKDMWKQFKIRFKPQVLVLTCMVWKQIKGLLIIFSEALDLPATLALVLKEMFQCRPRLSPSGRAREHI